MSLATAGAMSDLEAPESAAMPRLLSGPQLEARGGHDEETQEEAQEELDIDKKLFLAAERGDLIEAEPLLAQGARPSAARNEDGLNALMMAIALGHQEMALRLISAGADPMAESLDGSTALSLAATNPKIDERLIAVLAVGAHVDKRDKNGHTPLMSAILSSKSEGKVKLLASHSNLSVGFASPLLHKPEMPILNFARLFGSFSGIDCERIVAHEIERRKAVAEAEAIGAGIAAGAEAGWPLAL